MIPFQRGFIMLRLIGWKTFSNQMKVFWKIIGREKAEAIHHAEISNVKKIHIRIGSS